MKVLGYPRVLRAAGAQKVCRTSFGPNRVGIRCAIYLGWVRADGDTIFQSLAFSRSKLAPRSLQAPAPLLYEAHRRSIASIC